jgi:Uma2 family endonuclease
MATVIEPLMTLADLDAMPDDGNRYEIIEGELFVSCAPSLNHQRIIGKIFISLSNYLAEHPIGEVFMTPGVIFSEHSAVIPDIVLVGDEQRDEIASGDRIYGAPVLAVEILSPGGENMRRDRVSKRQLYGRHGVREYWIVSPGEGTVEVYGLREGRMEMVDKFGVRDEMTSRLLPDYRARVASFFAGGSG